jgi:hypothetical protein
MSFAGCCWQEKMHCQKIANGEYALPNEEIPQPDKKHVWQRIENWRIDFPANENYLLL